MKKYWKFLIFLISLILILNLISLWKPFANAYLKYVYPYLTDGLGKLTSCLSFPLGEILMYLGILLLFLAVLLLVILLFMRKSAAYRGFCKFYYKLFLFALLVLLFLYTTNWVIPFHATSIYEQVSPGKDYDFYDLSKFRAWLISKINESAKDIPRDASGSILYDEKVDQLTYKALRDLSDAYPNLSGYYPKVKVALCSDFLDWMGIGGYTYPFTMEATISFYTTRMYYPTLLAHEMSHHKGYYQECDANFISYIALAESDSPYLNYSAYLEIYAWIDNTYMEFLSSHQEEEYLTIHENMPSFSEQVMKDSEDIAKEYQELYESNVNQKMESMAADAAADVARVGWETQDQILDELNYDGVVAMLLDYYQGTAF